MRLCIITVLVLFGALIAAVHAQTGIPGKRKIRPRQLPAKLAGVEADAAWSGGGADSDAAARRPRFDLRERQMRKLYGLDSRQLLASDWIAYISSLDQDVSCLRCWWHHAVDQGRHSPGSLACLFHLPAAGLQVHLHLPCHTTHATAVLGTRAIITSSHNHSQHCRHGACPHRGWPRSRWTRSAGCTASSTRCQATAARRCSWCSRTTRSTPPACRRLWRVSAATWPQPPTKTWWWPTRMLAGTSCPAAVGGSRAAVLRGSRSVVLSYGWARARSQHQVPGRSLKEDGASSCGWVASFH